jgi:hypothetical protein
MRADLGRNHPRSQRVATILLGAFLSAVLVALAITIYSAAIPVGLLALSVVSPIVILTLVLLYYQRRWRRWSYLGASILGLVGVALRLTVNAQPNLEVGGGLPLEVNIVYLGLGLSTAFASLWAYISMRPRVV